MLRLPGLKVTARIADQPSEFQEGRAVTSDTPLFERAFTNPANPRRDCGRESFINIHSFSSSYRSPMVRVAGVCRDLRSDVSCGLDYAGDFADRAEGIFSQLSAIGSLPKEWKGEFQQNFQNPTHVNAFRGPKPPIPHGVA